MFEYKEIHHAIAAAVQTISPNAPEDEKAVLRKYLETALVCAGEEIKLRKNHESLLRQPVPKLSAAHIEAIKKRGQEFPWAKRSVADDRTPVEWVRDYYGEWIPGLLTEHLKAADPMLYAAFMKVVSRKGDPIYYDAVTGKEVYLNVPTRIENQLRGIEDPRERLEMLIRRRTHTALRPRRTP